MDYITITKANLETEHTAVQSVTTKMCRYHRKKSGFPTGWTMDLYS